MIPAKKESPHEYPRSIHHTEQRLPWLVGASSVDRTGAVSCAPVSARGASAVLYESARLFVIVGARTEGAVGGTASACDSGCLPNRMNFLKKALHSMGGSGRLARLDGRYVLRGLVRCPSG